jgi:hypothetical protein
LKNEFEIIGPPGMLSAENSFAEPMIKKSPNKLRMGMNY